MAIKTKAIVLGNINYKEKDKLVDLFTLEEGRLLVSMKGVRGEKAKLKMAKEPFCFGEFVIEKGKTNIVTQVEIIDNFYDPTKDIDKYYESCAILDVVKQISSQQDLELFLNIIKALKIICYENVKKYYVFDKFLINLTNILGYSFVSDRCSSCNATLKMAYFDLNKGCLVCPKCKTDSAIKISENCLKDLIYLFKCDYIDLKSENFIKSEKEILKVLALNLEWRVGLKILRIN